MDKNTHNDLAFFEMMLCAMSGESPSVAIENQEKRGQQAVVRNQRLPKKANSHTVPRDIFFNGVENKMSYEEREKITTANIIEYTRAKYERMGIEIIEEYDDLFWSVKLPEGWEIRATDHTMWNELIDNKGKKRATFFYKAAFYDRDAFTNFQTRFQVSVDHTADPSSDYEVWCKSDYIGTVKDGEEVIYKTDLVAATGDYSEDDKVKKVLWDELEDYMGKNYPDYKDINAYWEL
jgi:hypothetical protein